MQTNLFDGQQASCADEPLHARTVPTNLHSTI